MEVNRWSAVNSTMSSGPPPPRSLNATAPASGFVSRSPNGSIPRDRTANPRVSHVKIYSTRRKLLQLLQSSYDSDSASHAGQMQSLQSDSKGDEMKDEIETIDIHNSNDSTEALSNTDQSGLSTTVVEKTSSKTSPDVEIKEDDICITSSIWKTRKCRTKLTFVLSMIVIVLAIITVFIRKKNYDDSVYLVPT